MPDYAALADAYGAKGFVAEDADYAHRGARARRSRAGRTAVVDCRVDPAEHCFPMIPAGASALELVEYPADDDETVTA